MVLSIAIDSYNFIKETKIVSQKSSSANLRLKDTIKDSLRQFKKSFKSLQNIFKFGKKETLESIEKYINN